MELFPESKTNATKRFCNRWSLEEAVGKCLDVRFQESSRFPRLISELYAHAFEHGSETLFRFISLTNRI